MFADGEYGWKSKDRSGRLKGNDEKEWEQNWSEPASGGW